MKRKPKSEGWLHIAAVATSGAFLCDRRRKSVHRFRTLVAFASDVRVFANYGVVWCADCRKLASMTDVDRAAAMRERAAKKTASLGKLKAKREASCATSRTENEERAQLAREDASAALDAWEDGRRFLVPDVDLSSAMSRKVSTASVLADSIIAYRIDHPKSRGSKLYVFEKDPARDGRGNVACRFCRVRLVSDAFLGTVFTDDPEVHEHTVTCALRYLVGIKVNAPDGCTDPEDEHAACESPCGLAACDPSERQKARAS